MPYYQRNVLVMSNVVFSKNTTKLCRYQISLQSNITIKEEGRKMTGVRNIMLMEANYSFPESEFNPQSIIAELAYGQPSSLHRHQLPRLGQSIHTPQLRKDRNNVAVEYPWLSFPLNGPYALPGEKPHWN